MSLYKFSREVMMRIDSGDIFKAHDMRFLPKTDMFFEHYEFCVDSDKTDVLYKVSIFIDGDPYFSIIELRPTDIKDPKYYFDSKGYVKFSNTDSYVHVANKIETMITEYINTN